MSISFGSLQCLIAVSCSCNANSSPQTTSLIDGLSTPLSRKQLTATSANFLRQSGAIFPCRYGSIISSNIPLL
uniref:Uncharacterized protein n=1 Tax=Manihot esculenta TaxID=3983 RepID=A0A2C9WJR6_MANES